MRNVSRCASSFTLLTCLIAISKYLIARAVSSLNDCNVTNINTTGVQKVMITSHSEEKYCC